MVLGLGGSKGKKGSPVSAVYDITINEVKPWPSKSLPPQVMIQWQRGEKRTGCSKSVAGGDKDRITFNETFTIPATLYKLPPDRSKSKKIASPRFHKKCIVFTLCQAQQQGAQPLGRAVLDLADYGSLDRAAVSSVPLAVARKEFSALGTPYLSFTISPQGAQILPATTSNSSSSSPLPLQEEEDNHASLIAALVSDEEEDDIAAFTDDELDDDGQASVSSSKTTASSPAAAPDHHKVVTAPPSSSPPSPSPSPSPSPAPPSRSPSPSPAPPSRSPSPSPAPPARSPSPSPSPPPPPPPASSQGNNMEGSISRNGAAKSAAAAAAASAYATASKKRASFNSSSSSAKEDIKEPKAANVLQAARMKYAEGAGERSEKLDKKAVEEARQRAAAAEKTTAAAVAKANALEMEMEDLKSELRDAAALELALYSVVAQHGSSSHKIHASARRLARMYMHTCKNSSQHARASTARSCASGLVVVVRACENDVSRLTFWWSNVVVLREMIAQDLDVVTPSPSSSSSSSSSQLNTLDWREASTLTSTLERIEAWIFGRIVECIWWQSLTPHMQSSAAAEISSLPSTPTGGGAAVSATTPSETSVVSRFKKSVRGFIVADLGSSRQGNISIEIWKSAFLDALQRICPVRAGGHDCGCLQVVTKMIVEQCVARLDVAMFNAILRDMEENVPTDPISDPITDLSVLPIPPDNVSFGGGAQLKNVINTWSTWLLTLTADAETGEAAAAAAAQENVEKGTSHFTLLRAMSDLLMLPKDMLMDKSVRKEVCPALSLLLIRRVMAKFVPDDYSPDPVPPSLLAAINAEISMERQRVGEADISPSTVIMASAPPVVYFPPPSSLIRNMLNGQSANARLSRSASLFRKGHTSDDELEELESPLFLLVDNACVDPKVTAANSLQDALAKRYRLLRQVWKC